MLEKEKIKKKVIIIAGPTASGKSLIALSLAEQMYGEIINADSIQIYKGLPILTSQPPKSFLKRVPHYLYGVINPFEKSTAKFWSDLAYNRINKSYKNSSIPIVVGGTGMYIETLMSGLSYIPKVSSQVREDTEKIIKKKGSNYLYEKLKISDPDLANRISPFDSQRVARGWNVWVSSGKKLTEWQSKPRQNFSDLKFLKVLVSPSRNSLRELCKRRFKNMMENDVIQEVSNNMHYEDSWPIYKTLGYREIRGYLSGRGTLEKATTDTIIATQKYAKRQLTWFRNKFQADLKIESIDQIDLLKKKIQELGFSN